VTDRRTCSALHKERLKLVSLCCIRK